MTAATRSQPAQTRATASPIFLLGAPHSGTSVVAWALAQHPLVDVLHGAGWLSDLCTSLAAVEDTGRRIVASRSTVTVMGQLAQAGIDHHRFWRSFGESVEALLSPRSDAGAGSTAPHWQPTGTSGNGWKKPPGRRPTRWGLRRRVAHPHQRWVSAEAENDQIIYALRMLFPDAPLVHLVRRPEAAIAAMTTRSRANPAPLEAGKAAARWIEATTNGLDAERAFGASVLRVEYERLTADPEGTLRTCLEFVGLPWDAGCLRLLGGMGGLAPSGRLESGSGPTDAPAFGAGRRALSLKELPRAPEIAAVVARLQTASPPGTADSSAAALARLSEALHRRLGAGKEVVRRASGRVGRCRALIESSVPSGSMVAVVSRGEDALLDLNGVVGVHFPQTEDGAYAGYHPASSGEALTHLERLRQRGVRYLALPQTAFWWLDYYAGFRGHLFRHHQVVGYQADSGFVFALDGAGSGSKLLTYAVAGRTAEAPGAEHRTVPSPRRAGQPTELARLFVDAIDHFLVWEADARVTSPEGWARRELVSWNIATHPALPVREVHDAAGHHIGWLLGHIVSSGMTERGPVRLTATAADGPEALEKALYCLSGRYVCVLDIAGGPRIYLDAGGTLAAVYGDDRQVIASTTSLLQAATEGPGFPRPPAGDFPADQENQFYPAGLTHLPWARRLLPNHFLDLHDWGPRRHWPDGDIATVRELDVVSELYRITSGLSGVMRGLAASFDLYLGLTAGRDSRVLLACGRDVADAISTFSFDYGPAQPAAVDVVVARGLARMAGVPHAVVPVAEPTAEEKASYLEVIGWAGHWGKCKDFAAAGRHLKLGRVLVPGFLGGLGRGHYWPKMPKSVDALGAKILLRRMRLPDTKPFRRAVDEWLAGLPPVQPRLLLDLLYLEQRGGCWAGPHLYGAAPFQAIVVPYASRQVLDAMFRLPHEYRSRKQLYEDVVRLRWPELLEFPFQALPERAP